MRAHGSRVIVLVLLLLPALALPGDVALRLCVCDLARAWFGADAPHCPAAVNDSAEPRSNPQRDCCCEAAEDPGARRCCERTPPQPRSANSRPVVVAESHDPDCCISVHTTSVQTRTEDGSSISRIDPSILSLADPFGPFVHARPDRHRSWIPSAIRAPPTPLRSLRL